MKYNKVKAIDINIFLIPTIIISVFFIFLGFFMSNQISVYYTDIMRAESLKLARNTSTTLSKSSSAFEIINKFMAEKIQAATETVVNYDGTITQERLVSFADTLNVDVIYYYNSNGEIIVSNTGEYIGWQGKANHPVEQFRLSNQKVLVEEIRRDTESNIYYKYGYAKAKDGYFVQIGIYAQDVYHYLSEFEEQSIINELKLDEDIIEISILDKQYKIVSSSNPTSMGQSIALARIINSENGELYQSDKGQVYEVFAPVNINSVNVGFLSIQYNLQKTQTLIDNVTNLGFVSIVSLYLIVLIVIFNSYQKNRKLIQLAFFDTLTSLPNIDYLKYYVEQNLKKDKTIKALILINCVNFKRINISYGYKEGDFIIRKMSEKLSLLDKNVCTLFKFNADRFIVLIENVSQVTNINPYILKIEEMFANSEFKPDLEINMGVVEIDKVKHDVDEILKDASIALNNVEGNQHYAFYDAKMQQKIHREDRIEVELKNSIQARDKDRIYFQYQPIFDLKNHTIIAFEALARLYTKHYGSISPVEFIEIAEKRQLIVPLGEYLLNEACLLIQHLAGEGYGHIKVAVNISGIQVMQDEFVYIVERMLKRHSINPTQLEIEITESVYMQDLESINLKLFHLREIGISISMDDFGTGFSSFYRLKEAYLDVLKIDRYFVKNIDSKQDDKMISKDIISIGHKYGLKCVAEGIENAYQLESLKMSQCDYGQGFYLSYPVDEDEVCDLIKKYNTKERVG